MLVENARISFPNIFRPSAFQPGQDEKYSATFILKKGSAAHKAVEQEAERVIKEKWPKGAPKGLKMCLRDGEEKDMDGFGEDVMFFNASNKKRPGVFDRDRTPLVEADGKPYAGSYVNAIVDIWAQDNAYGKRINASLTGVQFAKDGDGFGGGSRSAGADDFAILDDGDDFLD